MDVDAFLADSADAIQGKIYGLGIGWNTIYSPTFPTVHARISVGVVIHVPYTATNQMHTVAVHLQDQDGKRVPLGADGQQQAVYELGGQFNVGRPALLPPGDEQVIPLAVTVNNLAIDKPDLYAWIVSIDGTPVRRLPMRVSQLVLPTPNPASS